MSNEHEIRSVADFVNLPVEKIGPCMNDFMDWLYAIKKLENQGFLDAMRETIGLPESGSVSWHTDTFQWIDDGIGGISSVALVTNMGDEIGRFRVTYKDEVAQ